LIYSPHGRDLLTLFEETFEAAHPEVDVRWLDMGSQEVYDRVRTESANPQADVWFGGPAAIFARAAEEGLLEPYRPAWADAVPPTSRDPENRYFGVYRTPPVIVYNSDAVAEEDAPRDWSELLEPQWQGKVLIRDPLASGTMRTIFSFVVAWSVRETGSTDVGFNWLRRLDFQTKEYVHSPALLHQKMVRQEGLVTMWELTDILFQQQRGNPLGYRFPAGGTPVIDDAAALVRGARRADVARTFLDWIGSKEAQALAAEKAFRLPARTDMPADSLPPWAREALEQMVPADVDWRLIEAESAGWMATWDRTIRGKGTDLDASQNAG
jgi:iron(III) transport system substrate-binding protein